MVVGLEVAKCGECERSVCFKRKLVWHVGVSRCRQGKAREVAVMDGFGW